VVLHVRSGASPERWHVLLPLCHLQPKGTRENWAFHSFRLYTARHDPESVKDFPRSIQAVICNEYPEPQTVKTDPRKRLLVSPFMRVLNPPKCEPRTFIPGVFILDLGRVLLRREAREILWEIEIGVCDRQVPHQVQALG
jgi:hypothetical protein